MTGKRVGYIRVSTIEQNTERQLENVQLDKIFTDKCSGKDVERPALEELMDYIRDGDKVIVHSMDRLARNVDDLRRLVKIINGKQAVIEFRKEGLTFTGEDSPMSTLMLSVMGAFAEFERAIIKERQMEGIALAKKRGVYKGRKPSLNEEQITALKLKASLGESKSKLAREFNVSRETLYKYLKMEAGTLSVV